MTKITKLAFTVMLHFYLRTSRAWTPCSSGSRKRNGHSDSIRSMGHPYAPQRIFMRLHDMSWARRSHLPVRERSPDIPLDGVMQDGAYLLRRILLLGTSVYKGPG
jgi:hypothetical protein